MLDLLLLREDGGCISTVKLVEFLASVVVLLPGPGRVEARSEPFSAVWKEFLDLGGTTVSKLFDSPKISTDWLTHWAA